MCTPSPSRMSRKKENKRKSADEPDPTTHTDTGWFPIHHDLFPGRRAPSQPEAATSAITLVSNPARTIDEAIALDDK